MERFFEIREQTYIQTDKHTDTLITILCISPSADLVINVAMQTLVK